MLKKITKVAIEKNDAYLFIARLSREKGAELFCQALTDLNLKGYVLGDGELMKELKEKYPKIVFCGWVDGEEKEKFILKGKGLIFPSLWYEGSPLTILEMISCGITCFVPYNCDASEDFKYGVTGFVFQKFGMVPKEGDTKIELEIENMHIIIDKIKEHLVEHAIIEIFR